MSDKCIILARNAPATQKAGASLADTLYTHPVTIALTGELGAGKTTFLQGFASALGIREPLVSPTYALEQRYQCSRGPFHHLDLYRLTSDQSLTFLRDGDDSCGIRCIEWSERVSIPHLLESGPVIHVDIVEQSDGTRQITCAFHDQTLPSDADITRWRAERRLPSHIIRHCQAVARVAAIAGDECVERGTIVRRNALRSAADIHDLLRFLDFTPGGFPEGYAPSSDEEASWAASRAQFPGMHHEEACATFLRSQGYDTVADIVEPHGLSHRNFIPRTTEQKLLYYSDKRVRVDRVVSIDERFADFAKRYGNGVMSDSARAWKHEVEATERDLFPEGPPPIPATE